MTTLRVVIDGMLDPSNRSLARYAEELTRGLIATAPRGCDVEGIVSASTEAEYEHIRARLPGLGALYKSALSRRELVRAWQHGFTLSPGRGMIHATSLLAPLRKHDRLNAAGDQIVVTIHDMNAWTAPDTVEGHAAGWQRSIAKRAEKYADAVVVPSHALADELAQYVDFGDRIRVIAPAVATAVTMPIDADERAVNLSLPGRYLVTLASVNPRKGLRELLTAITDLDIPLVVLGSAQADLAASAEQLGMPADRVLGLSDLADADYATVLGRAVAFIEPSLLAGGSAAILEAMSLGTPVVATNTGAAVELASDAALFVELEPSDGLPERLRHAIESVLADDDTRSRLSITGRDRARLFSWNGAAEKVWQLHADL